MRQLINDRGGIDNRAVTDLAKENYRRGTVQSTYGAILSAAFRLARAQKEAAIESQKEAAIESQKEAAIRFGASFSPKNA